MSPSEASLNLIKLWVLTGCLSVSLLIVGYFFKRILDSLDARAEDQDDRLDKCLEINAEQNLKIIQVLAQVSYLSERIVNLEYRLDKRPTSRQ